MSGSDLSESGIVNLQSIRCSVCFDQFQNSDARKPRNLNCGHSFCTDCLTKVRQVEHTIPCPICNVRTDVRGGINNLVVNRAVLDVVASRPANQANQGMDIDVDDVPASNAESALAGSKRRKIEPVSCRDCKRMAVWYCATCPQPGGFCRFCWEHPEPHRHQPSHHKKQSLKDKPATCADHPQFPLLWCCVDDGVATCDRCHLVGAHQGHKATDLARYTEVKINELAQTKQEVQELQTKRLQKSDRLKWAAKTISSKIQGQEKLVNTVLTDIARSRRDRLEPLEELQEDLKQEIDRGSEALEKITAAMDVAQHNEPDRFLREVASVVQLCSTARENASSVETQDIPVTLVEDCKQFSLLQKVQALNALCQACIDLSATANTRLSERREQQRQLVWKCLQTMGSCDLENAGLCEDDLRSANGCLFCRNGASKESLNQLLLHVGNFLSTPSQLSDSTVEGSARLRGALLALRMTCTACAKKFVLAAAFLPQPCILLAVIARILNDAAQSHGVVDLALSYIVPYAANASALQAASLVDANMHKACISVVHRYSDHGASRRITALQMLCQITDRAVTENGSNLIKDGVVLTLVQSLQRPVDHPKIAALVYAALKNISTLPDGKAALQSLEVRKAFALAFKQHYPQHYSDSYVWNHAPSIAQLIYCGDWRTDLKLSTGVTEIIQTCIYRLTKGLFEPRGPEKIASSVNALVALGLPFDYTDEMVRQGAVPIVIKLMRQMQEQRSDYWLPYGFSSLLIIVHLACWPMTEAAASARCQFTMPQGCDLFIDVLGDGTAATRPGEIGRAVLKVLYTLCKHVDSAMAVKQLPPSSKEIIKRAMVTHAEYFQTYIWWKTNDATAKLLQTLDAVQE